MTTKISKALRSFFDAEERNYQEMLSEARTKNRPESAVEEPTLFTAAESLAQAPEFVIMQWLDAENDAEACLAPLAELAWLIVRAGSDASLGDFTAE